VAFAKEALQRKVVFEVCSFVFVFVFVFAFAFLGDDGGEEVEWGFGALFSRC